MARFHIKENGDPAPCDASVRGCPRGGEEDHYSSVEEARAAYEAKKDAFSVVLKKGSTPDRVVNVSDADLSQKMSIAQQEFEAASDKAKWIEEKVNAVANAQAVLTHTLPGTPLRAEALQERSSAREDLLAADLVVWRDSPFYNEGVESRMKETAINVSDADSSLEAALADDTRKAEVANAQGISVRDVENILELAHQDYLRPRGALSTPIGSLSSNPVYAADTAHVFRIDPSAARAVLNYAASYSKLETVPSRGNSWDELLG